MCSPQLFVAGIQLAQMGVNMVSKKREGRYNRGVAAYNARVAENQAQEVRNIGIEEENLQRLKTAQLLSKQRAQLGASGVEIGSGSALQLQEDTATLGEADALRIRSNVESQALALETGAGLTRRRGEFAQDISESQAFGTLLGGTADILDTGVADKWFKPNSAANQQTIEV